MLDFLGDDGAHEDLLEIGGRRQKEVPVGKLGTELLQQLRGLLYYYEEGLLGGESKN